MGIAVFQFISDAQAADIGTVFTYQGFLENESGPVTGTCDFQFGLWDALTGGNQKGTSPQTETAVDVVGGVFTVDLDFGATAINGQGRWLEIVVCCPSGCVLESLDPRVELTPTPYSIRAGEGVGGPNALNVTPSGNVGIGTTAPAAKLHVAGIAGTDGIRFPDGTLQTTASTLWAASGNDIHNTNSGSVGIGTTTPAAQLDVNGAARTTTLEITGGLSVQYPLAGWGLNTYGQTDVPAGTFIAVDAGASHGLAIRSDGTLVGWGNNFNGQTNVPSGTFIAVAAGWNHSLAIRSDGTLVGWGNNVSGQINVPSGTYAAVAAGGAHSLAIRSDGTLAGWGWNGNGQIDVPTGTFTVLAAGDVHSLAVSSDGTLAGWGWDFYGQSTVPPGTFIAVAAGAYHSLGIRSDGTLIGWGYNGYGQIDVPEGTFTVVTAGGLQSLGIRSEGTLVGWGNNDYGQIEVPSGTFTAVAAGESYNLAIGTAPPSFALLLANDLAAKPGSNTWTIFSDRRLKKNIEPLSGALERLLQLHGVTFQWLDPASQGGITGTQMGLIADEVQRAFPQWVGRDPKGYQTLTVGGFEALTAEALRELRAEKDRQLHEKDCEIEELRSEIVSIKELVRALGKENGGSR
jgi:hypothetical protein